jgi:cell division protein FtsI/penicillin-binding protein 2
MHRLAIASLAALLLGAASGRPDGQLRVDLTQRSERGGVVVAPVGGTVTALTLDPRLQDDAERLLDGARPLAGAIVAVDVRTGNVLSWAERRRERGAPSVVATAHAPAASVFKMVTTAALFERAEVAPSEPVCIAGGLRAIERRHLDPPRGGDVRCSPFFHALGHSKNAAYAQLATHRLLRTDLIEVAERIGFNRPLPFDFPVLLGTLDVPYGDLEFARTAAGFRGTTLSPLGAAYLATIVATGGLAPRLRLIAPRDGEAPRELEVVGRAMSTTTAHRLERMMEVTVESGTARSAFHDDLGHSLLGPIKVAGKTGTLHPADDSSGAVSWFVGFAPARRPTLVVSVLLENRSVWRRKAAEVARDVLRAYFAARGTRGVRAPFGD